MPGLNTVWVEAQHSLSDSGYENNFMDATYDFDDQAEDMIRLHLIRFKIGIIF
ncbi:MAG: hypothetical protein R2744_12450 [Bacteroidales bacterium]